MKYILFISMLWIYGCKNTEQKTVSNFNENFNHVSDKFNSYEDLYTKFLIEHKWDSAMYYKGKADAYYEMESWILYKK